MALQVHSSYAQEVSAEAPKRYVRKILATGLQIDPYSIKEEYWTREPESIPKLTWTDLVSYMISTASEYTKEAIKVSFVACEREISPQIGHVTRLGKGC